ncbi:MAG: Do family serine endopeptidase [Armatimonadetes bacterium]|nr:Do family serine endopeptidase [Armatimonadota bacterium]
MRTAWKAAINHPGLMLVLICLLSVALGFSLAGNFYHRADSTAIAAVDKAGAPSDWRTVFEDVAKKLEPSVVFITSEKTVEVNTGMPNLDDFFNFGPFGGPRRAPQRESRSVKASGSGVIVRSDGYIMTNNHVVAGADRVMVKLSDGREFKGKVFLDPVTDLALVKIDAKDLPAAQFADSDKVVTGEWSVAIGNPFGLQNTVTVGVVSALRKGVDPDNPLPYAEVIQTDASINPGNSGGPLVDLEGRVMGINGAIYSTTGSNVGIGFAIPANTAKYVMTQLIDKGKVIRGFLGIEMMDLTPTMAAKLGARQGGALVTDVNPDSAAKKAGIQQKDVIVKVNGKDVRNAAELRRAVETIPPGTEIKVVVIREKVGKTLNVKLMERPATEEEAANAGDGQDKTGLTVQPLTSDIAKQLGVDEDIKGVVVRTVEPGSAGDRAGIKHGDVITEIEDTPITSVASFSKATKALKSGDTAIVVVQRGTRSVILEMPID